MQSWPIQQAIYSRLAGYQPLADLLADNVSAPGNPAVYDDVPNTVTEDSHFPYVAIGEVTVTPFDTDTSTGVEAVATLHTWSRYSGRMESKKIQDAIYDALHRHDLQVSGAHTVTVEFERADSLEDEDGVTRHGVSEFRVVVEHT